VNIFKFFNFVFFLLQEFAEALKEFSPEHEGIKDAQHNMEELERLKHELEQKRKNQLEEAKKEQQGRISHFVAVFCRQTTFC
jgi:butyrate kinase